MKMRMKTFNQHVRRHFRFLQERHNHLFEENHRLKKDKTALPNDISSTSEENESISIKYNGVNRSIYSAYSSNGSRDELYPYTRSASKYPFPRVEPTHDLQPTKDENSPSRYKTFAKGIKSLPVRQNGDTLR